MQDANQELDSLLDDLTLDVEAQALPDAAEAPPAARPRRELQQMLRKISVTLSLEVGATDVTLDQLMAIETGSVLELDALAGTPLTLKVNGTPIGRAEVVVAGENYGLKVVELSALDLLSFDPQG